MIWKRNSKMRRKTKKKIKEMKDMIKISSYFRWIKCENLIPKQVSIFISKECTQSCTKTSTKFVQKLRELNKGEHIWNNVKFLNILLLSFLDIIICNANSLQYMKWKHLETFWTGLELFDPFSIVYIQFSWLRINMSSRKEHIFPSSFPLWSSITLICLRKYIYLHPNCLPFSKEIL